jgi:hypothetical protein
VQPIQAAPSTATALGDVPPRRPENITIRIAASPATAKIWLDDQVRSGNPFSASVNADTVHHLRVEAPGHVPRALDLVFENDSEVVVELEKDRRPRRVEASKPAPTKPTASGYALAGPSPSSGPASKDCAVPYRLDEQGIKVFRAECM